VFDTSAGRELASRLEGEGIPNLHRWSYILIGATDEDSAQALAARLGAEAPAGAKATVERNQRAIYDNLPAARSQCSAASGLSKLAPRVADLPRQRRYCALREDASTQKTDGKPPPAPAPTQPRRQVEPAARSGRSSYPRSPSTAPVGLRDGGAGRPSGAIEWMCLPGSTRPACSERCSIAMPVRSGSVPTASPCRRPPLPAGTMVMETSWGTGSGWIIVRDVLLIGHWHHQHDRSHTHRRAPTDYDADHVLLRMIRCVNGEVQVLLDCEPKFDYGRDAAEWTYTGDGYHEGTAPAPTAE